MKKTIILIAGLLCTFFGYAQKKPLDHSVYDSWQSIGASSISDKGNVLIYEINPQEGDGKLFIRDNKNKITMAFDRGYSAKILPDESFVIFRIKPFFQDTRKAKIKKLAADKMPKDSMAVYNIATGKTVKFSTIESFSIGDKANSVFAFMTSDTTCIKKADRKKKDLGKPLLIYHFRGGKVDTLQYVSNYRFNRDGSILAYTTKEGKKNVGVGMYDVSTGKSLKYSDDYHFFSLPNISDDGTKALFLASKDTTDSGDKHCEVIQYKVGSSSPETLIPANYKDNLPEGWSVNQNSNPYYSKDGNRIYVGVAQMLAPKDTTLVPFETAGLDIWVYDAPEIPPYANKNKNKHINGTCLAVYNNGKLIPLTTSMYDNISTVQDGNASFALSRDETKYQVQTQWDMQQPVDISLVNLSNGERISVSSGSYSNISVSPEGKYVVWYDYKQRNWFSYNIATKKTLNLTENIGVNFWSETYDQSSNPDSYGCGGWTKGDKELMIYDRYDIWKIAADGSSANNLTADNGRKTNRTYRYINLKKDEDTRKAIAPNETMLLSVFDNGTKENGYATVNAAKCSVPKILFLGGYSFDKLEKAKYADTYIYTKGNFVKNMDLCISNSLSKSANQLTSINPQQNDYNWGTASLYHWTAYDGTKLDGILYKPENFDPNKKYPVMIYFYELNSQNLFRHYNPAPSRSIVCLPFYASRGYVVFVPDIVYKTGIPGECAYNCIVSGAESLTKYSWIDKDNMAIQGQSWGGYQVAYLITRTNMFKAAGAGAPVSNMTSAYGGIRWGSGMSRQFQYEQEQSRIGRNLWDALDLYMANSPLFRLPNVTTPVLIMHNDSDGAVPWYQGIEMFMGLRRLNKPAWLLEYNGEDHNLVQRRNTKDLTIRLQQFFDHYLQGAPEPQWMKSGIPVEKKGQYFGFEDAK